MCSKKQRLANQLNAKKSTGPTSDEGKAASARNAVTHGLTAETAIVIDEDREGFEVFSRALRAALRPRDAIQNLIVERIIFISWKLERVPSAEGAAFRSMAQFPLDEQKYNRDGRIRIVPTAGNVLATQMSCDSVLGRLQGYEMRLERSLHTNLRQLATLNKQAREEPDDFDPVVAQVAVPQAETVVQNEAISPVPLPLLRGRLGGGSSSLRDSEEQSLVAGRAAPLPTSPRMRQEEKAVDFASSFHIRTVGGAKPSEAALTCVDAASGIVEGFDASDSSAARSEKT